MTGPVSSKYLMMGDIWRGAAILMVIQSRIGPVSNPVCHCHTAAVRPSDHRITVVELIRGAMGNIAGGMDLGNIAGSE